MDDNTLDDSGKQLASQTPYTNRGSLTPSSITFKGFDYLQITSWLSPKNLIDLLEWGILDKYLPHAVGSFESQGPGRRIIERWTCAVEGLEVLEGVGWNAIRFKGKACTTLGNGPLLEVLSALEASGVRWQVSRCDFAWDGFPLSPSGVFRHLKAGNYKTRATLDPWFETNAQGDTCYTHWHPEARGIERYIRFYDMRGPTRLELVLRGRYAKQLCEGLLDSTEDELHTAAKSALRGFIDFLRPGKSRKDRRPLLAAWARFIGEAEIWRPSARAAQAEREGLEMLGPIDGQVQRFARCACEYLEAFGEEALLKRLLYFGEGRVRPDRVAKLKSIRSAAAHKGIAGVLPYPEEVDNDVEVPF